LAARSRTTFTKRQKEQARLEKQRDKAAKRMQRKLEKANPTMGGDQSDDALDGEILADSTQPETGLDTNTDQ